MKTMPELHASAGHVRRKSVPKAKLRFAYRADARPALPLAASVRSRWRLLRGKWHLAHRK